MEINFETLLAAVQIAAEEADGVISNKIITSFFPKNISTAEARELSARLVAELSANGILIVSQVDYDRLKAMKVGSDIKEPDSKDSVVDGSGLKDDESEPSEDEETEATSVELALEVDARSKLSPEIRRIMQLPLLSDKQTKELLNRVAVYGDRQAEARLVAHNIRLVLFIARRHSGRANHLLLNDLVQEGVLGLLEAIRRFDPNRGAKLTTYATWWIYHHISRALANQEKTVRFPVFVYDGSKRVTRVRRELRETLERDPTDAEIAPLAGLSLATVKTVRVALTQRVVSLDTPFGIGDGENNHTYGDIVPDAVGFERMERHLFRIDGDSPAFLRMFAGFNTLAREALFIYLARNWTLMETGKRFGFTRERIRQISEQSKPKMRKALENTRALFPEEVAYLKNAITLAQEAKKTERVPATLHMMRSWIQEREGRASGEIIALLDEHKLVGPSTGQIVELFWKARDKDTFTSKKVPGVQPRLAVRFSRVYRSAWMASQARLGKIALGIDQKRFEALWPKKDWYPGVLTGTEAVSEPATDTSVQPIALQAIARAIQLTERSLDELIDQSPEAFTRTLDNVEERIEYWRQALRSVSGNTQPLARRLQRIEERIRAVSGGKIARGSRG